MFLIIMQFVLHLNSNWSDFLVCFFYYFVKLTFSRLSVYLLVNAIRAAKKSINANVYGTAQSNQQNSS